jgi:PAS domain S-box-containing protein
VPALIWAAGPDAARAFFNKPWLDFTGRALDQERGFGWLDGVHPEDRQSARDTHVAAGRSRRPIRLEYRLRRRDGQYRWMLDSAEPQVAADGGFAGFVGSCTDITERKHAEAQLRALTENASDIISVIAPDGTIHYESPSIERLLGWRPEELIGTQLLDYVHPDDTAHVVGAIARRLADAAPVNPPTEFRVRARDGSWHVLAAMSRAARDETGAVRLVVNSRDVTEQRGLEEQLRQAQRMELMGQLAGGIAHDFNNLLTVIIGRSELLRQRLAKDDSARRNIELIQDTASRGAALTQQLLASSRRQMLQPRVLDLNETVAGITPMLERLIGEQITIAERLDPELDRIRGDQATLEQIIVNLVVNARDAMPHGGRIVLATANVELDDAFVRGHPGAAPGRHVVLTVSDTGIGMDAPTRARIFEPFFTTKGPGLGTGLGLAVVDGIVKQHRGWVAVESAPGSGSTFRVYLPRVDEPATAVPVLDDPGARAESVATVLVVEDDADVRELAANVLEEAGYTVIAAGGPREALAIVERRAGPLHLLLTDVVMPEMDGRVLAERIRHLRPEAKVLFMSGYAGEALGPSGVLDSGIALLPKPFTPSSLTGMIAEALRDEPPARAAGAPDGGA